MNFAAILIPFAVLLVVLLVLSRLVVSEPGADKQPVEKSGGALEFLPNAQAYWGVYGFTGVLGLVGLMGLISLVRGGGGWVPAVFCAAFVLLLLTSFPGSIATDAQGLAQTFWIVGTRRFAWDEVRSIAVDERKGRVTVKNLKGVKIVHTRQLPARARFLAELEAHCPDRMPGAKRVVAAPVG